MEECCDIVPWAPVFTRGRLKLVVLTETDEKGNLKHLNSSAQVARFVKEGLQDALEERKEEWGWTPTPKVILPDKASCFVKNNLLNLNFAEGLRAGRFLNPGRRNV